MRKRFGLLAGMILAGMAANVSAAQITEDDAKSIVLEAAGLEEKDVSFTRTKKDREDGRDIIEVEFYTEEKDEYDYEVIAEDGVILSASYECTKPAADGKKVTLEQAKEAAAEHAGLDEDEITFVKEKTGRDDGRTVHEIEFYTEDQKEYEYEIDADTGVILSWDYDGEIYIRQQKK
ncbi:MAG: PepSY domain-containing protein [Eubacteriales bacterium]|nr:PepSY domain-containing protein [Eubacteriales bacterium]